MQGQVIWFGKNFSVFAMSMLKIAVLAVWMGLLVLAASRATVWKAACVSHLDACNNSESKADRSRLVSKTDALVQAIAMWVPYTKTNGQWIASKLLQGFFGAPVESLCEISVTDIASPSSSPLSAAYSDSSSILHMKEVLTWRSTAFSSLVAISSHRSLQVSSTRDKDGDGSW